MNNDIEVIIRQLRQMQNAANVHTINGACGWLRALSKPVWFITNEERRLRLFKHLKTQCELAISTKNTVVLGVIMRRLF